MLEIRRLVVSPFATNCYLAQDGEDVMVVDPGDDGSTILLELARLKGKVQCIVNTHGHIDHVGANKVLRERTGAPLLIGADDAGMLGSPQSNLAVFVGKFTKSPTADRLLNEGDTVTVGRTSFTVYRTPGHTPGGICLVNDAYVFTGDTLFADSIGRTDFPGSSEDDMFASLARLKTLIKPDAVVLPGHGEPARFRDILRHNPFLR